MFAVVYKLVGSHELIEGAFDAGVGAQSPSPICPQGRREKVGMRAVLSFCLLKKEEKELLSLLLLLFFFFFLYPRTVTGHQRAVPQRQLLWPGRQ
jgi:hypothetical protein